MKRYLCLLIVTISTLYLSAEQRINGTWNGDLQAGFDQLTVVLNITGDSCTMDSPDQAAFGIPTILRICTEDSLVVEIPQLKVVYEGKKSGEIIEGSFTQMGHSVPLTLKAGKPVYKRTQNPQPPFSYKTEEVTFMNSKDGAVFSGTLSYPINYKKGVTPVVLMVTGSGLQNRDEETFYHRPFAVIADHLAQNGIATLRYDDRSVGQSTGDIKNATTATFAGDAEAGLTFLHSSCKFGKVGLLGHSEGGTIAFMLAGEDKTDFIISLAGSSLRGDKVLVGQNRLILPTQGISEKMTEDYCRALEKMYEYKIAYNPTSDMHAEMYVTMAVNETKANLPESLRANLSALMKTKNAWINYFIAYDPVVAIKKIKCPIMAANGSLDTQILPAPNLAVIRDNLQWKEGDVVREYEGLNHMFQHCKTGALKEYIKIEETISPEVLNDIVSFIISLKK